MHSKRKFLHIKSLNKIMNYKPYFNVCGLLLVVSLIASFCNGHQMGKGKFESFNGYRYTEAKSMNDNETKSFFNLNRNRPPAHDTPASPCSCSKLMRVVPLAETVQIPLKLSKRSLWKLFMQIVPTFFFH